MPWRQAKYLHQMSALCERDSLSSFLSDSPTVPRRWIVIQVFFIIYQFWPTTDMKTLSVVARQLYKMLFIAIHIWTQASQIATWNFSGPTSGKTSPKHWRSSRNPRRTKGGKDKAISSSLYLHICAEITILSPRLRKWTRSSRYNKKQKKWYSGLLICKTKNGVLCFY